MVIGAVTKGSERFKRTYEMVKRLKCFRRFRVWKGVRTFRKRFRSLLKYLGSFRVRKGAGNSEPPEPLCGSWLNTVTFGVSFPSPTTLRPLGVGLLPPFTHPSADLCAVIFFCPSLIRFRACRRAGLSHYTLVYQGYR